MRICKGGAIRIANDPKVFGNVSDLQLSQTLFLASKGIFEYKFYLSLSRCSLAINLWYLGSLIFNYALNKVIISLILASVLKPVVLSPVCDVLNPALYRLSIIVAKEGGPIFNLEAISSVVK